MPPDYQFNAGYGVSAQPVKPPVVAGQSASDQQPVPSAPEPQQQSGGGLGE